MKYAVVHVSQTGNTKLIADSIAAALPREDCLYQGTPNPAALAADLIFAGFWTNQGDCPPDLAAFLATLEGKKTALFGTAGYGQEQSYFDGILSRVSAHLPAGGFLGGWMCQGKMPRSVQARYAAALEKEPGDEHLKRMLKNFDEAMSHPDGFDVRGVTLWARKLWEGNA